MMTTTLRRAGLLMLAGVLAWRALVSGVAAYYAAQETPEADAGALRWQPQQPAALYRQGYALIERDPAAATPLLRAALWADPTNALGYVALAEQQQTAGNMAAAIRLMTIADQLGPMRAPALAHSALFWLQQNRLDVALARWSLLLQNQPDTGTTLFPVLLRLVETPSTRESLRPLLADPPKWWDRFFAYVVATSVQTESVTFLYQNRNRQGELPVEGEQKVYLNRLFKEQRWQEAYLAWLGGMSEQERQALGFLYNGGFELPITNLGFDWRIAAPRGVMVETLETYNTHGGVALRVHFEGERVHFQHVSQYLYLEPGRYQLRGQARLDGLQTERGLRWKLRCVDADATLLVQSELFVGSDDWRNFRVDFSVPPQDCPAQQLRLELEGQAELDFTARGDAWFDDFAISQQED